MEHYGKVFRLLRESKGMTLAKTAEGIVSTQQLSKFEREESGIRFDYLIQLIDRINIRYNEFNSHFQNNYEMIQVNFLYQYMKALVSSNIVLLKNLIENEKNLYENHKNIRHKHNIIMMEQRINKINNTSFNREKVEQIVQYLFNIDDWGYYEVVLFNNTMFCFDLFQIESLSLIAYKKARKYLHLASNSHELSTLLMNVINYMLENNHLNRVEQLINEVEKELMHSRYLYEKNRLNYFKGIYNIKIGNKEEGIQLCNTAIKIFTHFGLYDNAQVLSNEMDSILESYQ